MDALGVTDWAAQWHDHEFMVTMRIYGSNGAPKHS